MMERMELIQVMLEFTLSLAVNLINMLGMLTLVVLLLLGPTMQQFQGLPLPQEVPTQGQTV